LSSVSGHEESVFGNSVPKLAEEEENESYQNAGDIAKNRSVFFGVSLCLRVSVVFAGKDEAAVGAAHGIMSSLA
jgi:hypothetical protein